MNVELNPKLLDLVEFDDSSLGVPTKRTGTIVEAFGEPSHAVLIEIADSQGLPEGFLIKRLNDVRIVWTAKPKAETTIPEAERYFEEAVLFLQNGLIGRAKAHFAKAFSLNEKLRANLLESTNDLARRGGLDAAIRVYSLLLELRPEYEIARENLSAAHVQRGIKNGRAGLLHEAIEDFKAALLLRPRRPGSIELVRRNLIAAYTHLAMRHSNSKLYSEAISYFVLAFELEPSDTTQRNVAIALVASLAAKAPSGSQVPSEEFFAQAIQMGLELSDALNAYGATLAQHGRVSEGISALEKAVQVDPENALARRNLQTVLGTDSPDNLPTGLTSLDPQEMQLSVA